MVVIGLVTIGIFIIGRWDKTRRVPTLRQSQAKDMQRTTTTPSPPPRSTSAALPLTPFKPDHPLSRVFTEEALAVDTIEVAEMTIADLYLVNNRIPSRLVSMAQQAVDRGQAATNYFLLSWAHDINGDTAQALMAIETAIKLDPTNLNYQAA